MLSTPSKTHRAPGRFYALIQVPSGMPPLFTFEFWARWLGIVIIDLTLAGDNALAIALTVRTLAPRQRTWGRILGSLGGVILRLAFVAVVTSLLKTPFLQLLAGLVLVWIALRLVSEHPGGAEHFRSGMTLLEAIWLIVLADVVMSLDNILAIAAVAKGDYLLVTFGISLSLPLVIWGSGLLAHWMNRHAWIIWLGGGILGYAAGEMILQDPVVQAWLARRIIDALHYAFPVVLGTTIAALGWQRASRHRA
jgi:YjbE family integral membrane protein